MYQPSWWLLLFLIMILRERGGEFAIVKICGFGVLFWGVDLGDTYKLLYFFSLQSFKCIGLRFLFPWAKANCHIEWTVTVFKIYMKRYGDNFYILPFYL